MARSTRNARWITVNRVRYRWRATGTDDGISVTIWPAIQPGPAINCSFDYHEGCVPADEIDGCNICTSTDNQIVITNRIVQRVIEFAISTHNYDPLQRGHEMILCGMDEEIELGDAIRANEQETGNSVL